MNKLVALGSASAGNWSCKNWFYYVNSMLTNCGAQYHYDISKSIPKHSIVNTVTTKLQENMFQNSPNL